MAETGQTEKIEILGLNVAEIASLLPGLPLFRSKQIFEAAKSGASSFESISSLPKNLRLELAEKFVLRVLRPDETLFEKDGRGGALKSRLAARDGSLIESVLLKDGGGRRTACISSQAGCPLACVFCKTGSLGFKRNLSAAEIIEQYFFLDAGLKKSTEYRTEKISNIVFMGMGEPLLNLENLERALNFFSGILSQRRVTISTAGITAGIYALAEKKLDCRLAVSITSADPVLRAKLMPVTLANPLPALKEALIFYQKRKKKRITLEAVIFKGINTREADIRAFSDFASGLEVLINLIPYNSFDGAFFEGVPLLAPSKKECEDFARRLETAGLKTVLRRSRGRGISGACGQLGTRCAASIV